MKLEQVFFAQGRGQLILDLNDSTESMLPDFVVNCIQKGREKITSQASSASPEDLKRVIVMTQYSGDNCI